MMSGKYQAYPEYKDSGSKWVDDIPADWEVVALKHVLSIPITDGPHSTPEFLDEGIPFVSAEAVSGGFIDFTKIRGFISEVDDNFFSQKYRPQKGDVFMIKSGATTGITAIVETDGRFNIWSPLAVMRCKETYSPYFLLNYLRSDLFQKSVQLSWTFGTQQNIGMGTLENLTVTVPHIEEQQKIANFLDHETAKIDTLIEKQQQLIKLLKEKRQAVISHTVTKGLNPDAPMRDSGVDWLGDVPEHWSVINVSHALNAIGDVDHYMPKSIENGVPYLMTGDLKELVSNIILKDCKQVSYKDYQALSKKIKSARGDVIMARYATIGTTAYIDVDDDFLVSYSCVTLKPNPLKALGLYLSYYFKSDAFLKGIKNQINANTQENVGINDLKKVKIALPTLTEQSEMIGYLHLKISKLDHISAKSQVAIKLMQERRTALISAAVTGKIDARNWVAPNA